MTVTGLADLSRMIADPAEDCVILAEGNTSCRADGESFWIKASGAQMLNADDSSFVRVAAAPLLQALNGSDLSDSNLADLLLESRCEEGGKPSTETFMHAFLLSLEGVEVVVHTHPTPLLALLCLENSHEIARQRLFPDELVCCGPRACLVPYTDPGLPLGQAVRRGVVEYRDEEGELPKTIWIQNHGLICLGETASEVLTATRMSVKAARIWLAALQTGQRLTTLTKEQIERIRRRPDEHYRQRMLWK